MTSSGTSFSHKIRIRVCGLLLEDNCLLLAQLHSPVINKLIWTPPGGGLEFGETMDECLKREFAEETGLKVDVNRLVHINEMINEPFHAVEFYFAVTRTGGTLIEGRDPELADDEQLLRKIQWKPVDEIANLPLVPENLTGKIQNPDSPAPYDSLFSSS